MKAGSKTMRKLRSVVTKLPLMLSCREFEEFTSDYFEGTLPKRQRAIFNMHLIVCPDCRSYLAAYRRTVALAKAVFRRPDRAVPEDPPEDLVKAILAANK